MTSDRELTAKEMAWIESLKRVMRRKPSSLTLFANGSLHVIDSDQFNSRKPGDGPGQPFAIHIGGACEGGDF